MSLTPKQQKLKTFLQQAEQTRSPVTAEDILAATGWAPSSVRTYMSKQLRPFLDEFEPGKFRVHGLSHLDADGFRRLLTQSGNIRSSIESEGTLERNLRALNPWWSSEPQKPVPDSRRWLFDRLYRSLVNGLAPVTVLRGPRRVGKTVLLRQVINQLMSDGVSPERILYVPFDDLPSLLAPEVILRIASWYQNEIRMGSLNSGKQPAFFIFDEIQNLDNWAAQVKQLADNFQVRILLTGSSSLRIQAEVDRLAGRISILDLGPLVLREVSYLSGLGPLAPPFWADGSTIGDPDFWMDAIGHCRRQEELIQSSFEIYSERGGYPIAYERMDADWLELSTWLQENVVVRALEHDLIKNGWRSRDEAAVLFELLRLVCRYAGQSPGLPTLLREMITFLGPGIKERDVIQGLEFLEGSRLMQRVRPMELDATKTKSTAKLCLCDVSLRAAWLQEKVSLLDEGALVGHIAESVLGYTLATIPGVHLSTYPERSPERPEVDFVLTAGSLRLPLEVKYQRSIDVNRDIRGLKAFLKNIPNVTFGLLATRDIVPRFDPSVISIPLPWLLWLR